MLIRSHRQEALSRAYIHAIAARCGLSCSGRDYDYGMDLSVHEVRQEGDRYRETGYRLDIQLKSTTAALATPSEIVYDLEVRAYDDLRESNSGGYRVLVLVLLPEDEADWTAQDEDGLLLRRCAYWMSLKGWPATPNTASVRIAIPRANVFSVDALNRLIAKVRKGEEL